MLKLAFAEPGTSARQSQLLERIHRRVQGTSREGVPYRAMDPDLLLWVWATLVDVSLLAYEAAVRRLDPEQRERYYQEQKLIAVACGIPRDACPGGYRDFNEYVERTIRAELRVTPVARIVAYGGRRPPLPSLLSWVAGAIGSLFAAAFLPEEFREPLGYRWTRTHEAAARLILVTHRAAARVVPAPARHLPFRYLIRRRTPLQWWSSRQLRLPEELAGPT
jgi:uncharacterized protein (DUF2236 family)